MRRNRENPVLLSEKIMTFLYGKLTPPIGVFQTSPDNKITFNTCFQTKLDLCHDRADLAKFDRERGSGRKSARFTNIIICCRAKDFWNWPIFTPRDTKKEKNRLPNCT